MRLREAPRTPVLPRLLAEAAARAAAGLVAANLVSMPGDERVAHAQRLADAATVAAKRAVAASASR